MDSVDVIIVGSGPNGMSAAVTLARAGLSVRVYEGESTIGGGARTSELTLPGFLHDVGSAVHPLALSSAFFRRFELSKRVDFIVPAMSYAHPLSDGRAGLAWRDLDRTAAELGTDGPRWRRLFGPLVRHSDALNQFAMSPLLGVPEHPIIAARFALRVLEHGISEGYSRFSGVTAPALLTGVSAHSVGRIPTLAGTAAGLVLATAAHDRGWPIAVGGSQSIIAALAADFIAHGGEIVTGTRVRSLEELPRARAVILNTSPRAAARLAAGRLPFAYRQQLESFRYGNAVAKVDFALSGAVPWRNPRLAEAGTVHLGGTRAELASAAAHVAAGRHPQRPYVVLSQPTVFDATRAPQGKHVLWAYTPVPANSTEDRTDAIVRTIEAQAPGFRDLILASTSTSAVEIENFNPNFIGGDIASGEMSLRQVIGRPVLSHTPWQTPVQGIYIASGSTAPGPGVHGLAGFFAACQVLSAEFGISSVPSLSIRA